MAAISCSAPGKIILCGEHAVVYNQPAIAIPIHQVSTTTRVFAHPTGPRGQVRIISEAVNLDSELSELDLVNPLRKTIELVQAYFSIDHLPACEIRIGSTIPIASGLGSSASTSVSLIRALVQYLGHQLPDAEINQLANSAEKIHHGNPSGVDNTVITYERPVYFRRSQTVEFPAVAAPLNFVIANTGIPASTSEAVTWVKERWQKSSEHFENLFAEIGKITDQIRQHLSQGNITAIGPLLTQNHHYLQDIGVSCQALDSLVAAALDAGALGAKLSGGGLGGNMLTLVRPADSEKVMLAN